MTKDHETDTDDDVRDWGDLQTIPTNVAGALQDGSNAGEDALLDVVYSLKPEYRAGASWIMNRKTAAQVRKFKDTDGRMIWAESLAAGEPPRLLGFPVALDEEMPDVGAGEMPIAFGDFASGKLDHEPENGGAVFNSEAIKLLRVGNVTFDI